MNSEKKRVPQPCTVHHNHHMVQLKSTARVRKCHGDNPFRKEKLFSEPPGFLYGSFMDGSGEAGKAQRILCGSNCVATP